jgi:DNA-binding transcriptional LysR family regulator
VDNLLEQGVLCRPFAESAQSEFGYYAVMPARKRRGRLVQVFVDWMLAEQNAGASQ